MHANPDCSRDLVELSKVDKNCSAKKWYTPLIPALEQGRQEALKFKSSLGYLCREFRPGG